MKLKRPEATKPEAPEARPSSIEAHGRWPEVRVFLDLEPGDNGALAKHLRDLARVEQEQRAAGSGPDLLGEIRRLEYTAGEAERRATLCPTCRAPVDAELILARDEAQDKLAAKQREQGAREARIAEIGKRRVEAHGLAVSALHSALRGRFKALAHEALLLVRSAPHAGRLPDSLLDVGRQVAAGQDLAQAFSSTAPGETAGEVAFWEVLPEDVRDLVEGKLLAGRSATVAAA